MAKCMNQQSKTNFHLMKKSKRNNNKPIPWKKSQRQKVHLFFFCETGKVYYKKEVRFWWHFSNCLVICLDRVKKTADAKIQHKWMETQCWTRSNPLSSAIRSIEKYRLHNRIVAIKGTNLTTIRVLKKKKQTPKTLTFAAVVCYVQTPAAFIANALLSWLCTCFNLG